MTRLYRQLLFFSSTLVFLAIAPLVILYAIGYRLGGATAEPMPVGVIWLETTPRHADVSVNGKSIGQTPRTIPDLVAGSADVTISKDGYVPWSKRVPVISGLVSEFRSIRLFPQNISPKELSQKVTLFRIAPNRQRLAVVHDSQFLEVLDPDGATLLSKIVLSATPQSLLWSPDSTSLLIKYTSGQFGIVQVNSATTAVRPLPALHDCTQIDWDPRISDRLLILTHSGDLQAYNITTNSSLEIANNISAFATSTRQVYALQDNGGLAIYTLQGAVVRTLTFPAKTPAVKQLFITPGGQIAVLQVNNSLSLLKNDVLVEVAQNVLGAAWSPDERYIYVQPEQNALSVYNVSDERSSLPLGQLQLITRLSRPITHPAWFAGGQHLIYQVDDKIMITEIDTRDHPITYTLDSTGLNDAMTEVGSEGQAIFQLKKNNDQTSLIAVPLVVPDK